MIPDPTPDDLKQDAEVRTLHDPACHFWLYHYEGHCTCGLRWESQLAHERKRAEAAERERDEIKQQLDDPDYQYACGRIHRKAIECRNDELKELYKARDDAERRVKEAERWIKSVIATLGWGNMPTLALLEARIIADRERLKYAERQRDEALARLATIAEILGDETLANLEVSGIIVSTHDWDRLREAIHLGRQRDE